MQRSPRETITRAFERVPSALWVTCVLVIGVACWLDAHRRLPWDIVGLDAMEYADIARHLAKTEG